MYDIILREHNDTGAFRTALDVYVFAIRLRRRRSVRDEWTVWYKWRQRNDKDNNIILYYSRIITRCRAGSSRKRTMPTRYYGRAYTGRPYVCRNESPSIRRIEFSIITRRSARDSDTRMDRKSRKFPTLRTMFSNDLRVTFATISSGSNVIVYPPSFGLSSVFLLLLYINYSIEVSKTSSVQ